MPRRRLALLLTILCLQCFAMGITGLLPAVAFGWMAMGTVRLENVGIE